MLSGYTQKIEPADSLRKVCGTEEFITESQARRLLCHVGDPDPWPGRAWTKANSDPAFLLALQKVKRDEWLNDENMVYWQYLHIGNDLPN